MAVYLKLPLYPTNRPAYIDASQVDAITDAMEVAPPKLAGGQPSLTIVGTTLFIKGQAVNIAGPCDEVAAQIEAARNPLSAFKAN